MEPVCGRKCSEPSPSPPLLSALHLLRCHRHSTGTGTGTGPGPVPVVASPTGTGAGWLSLAEPSLAEPMPPLESVGSGGGSVQRPAAMASDSGSGQPMTGARDGARQLAHAQDALALHVARLMHFALCPQADSSLHCLAAVARVNRPRCRVPVLPRPSSYLGLKDKCSVLYRTVPSLAPVSCFKHGSSTVFNTFNRYVSLCGVCGLWGYDALTICERATQWRAASTVPVCGRWPRREFAIRKRNAFFAWAVGLAAAWPVARSDRAQAPPRAFLKMRILSLRCARVHGQRGVDRLRG